MAELYDAERMPVDSELHKLNTRGHPALCRFYEQMGRALRAYTVGQEPYRDEVLARGKQISFDFEAAIDGLTECDLQQTKIALKLLARDYPALFADSAEDAFADIKQRHGVE